VAKIGIVVEEADETVFWLRFLKRADISAIFTKSAKTAGANRG